MRRSDAAVDGLPFRCRSVERARQLEPLQPSAGPTTFGAMSGTSLPTVIAIVVALLCASCASGSESATAPIESTTAPTLKPSSSVAETTVAPEPAPKPVLAAVERDGPFMCANDEPGVVTNDDDLAAGLEQFIGPGVPGLVAATANSDGLLRIGAAGVRSVDEDHPLLTTDRMHLGSDTKSMTAALLAVLAAEGDLELTTPITEIWPDADTGWQGVSLLDLLHHRGGAEDSLGRDQSALWTQLWESSIAAHSGTPDQRAAAARDERRRFASALTSTAPSEEVGQYAYSNSGYMLVGAALEERFQAPWEELMCTHLFEPLRMDGCGFGAVPAPGPRGHSEQADGLTATEAGGVGADNPFALGPAGTVHCPLADWARYLSWVLRGAQGADDRLSAETWQMLLEPEGDYAGGWQVATRPWSPGPIFTHAGSNTMWFAVAWVAPGIDRAFMVVSNAATPQAQAATDQAINLLIEGES